MCTVSRLVNLLGFCAMLQSNGLTQNIIQNGSFEQPAAFGNHGPGRQQYYANSTALTGWQILGEGDIFIHKASIMGAEDSTFGPAQDGDFYLDLSGSGVPHAIISQNFPTVAQKLYALTFYVGASDQTTPSSTINVQITGKSLLLNKVITPIAPSSAINWSEQSFKFVADSDVTQLSFVDTSSSDENASFVDNIVIQPATTTLVNMALIPKGSYQMGCEPESFYGMQNLNGPIHTVYLDEFYMDKYLVTKTLWNDVYAWAITNNYTFDNAGLGKAPNHPIQTINWYDTIKWCNARSEKEKRTPAYYTDAEQTNIYRSGQLDVQNTWVKWNSGYRLPTEAEWEKAARGGIEGLNFPWGNTISWNQANYIARPGQFNWDINPTPGYNPIFVDGIYPYTSPVDFFPPNEYGLYDMVGNVREWCWDWYGSYPSAPQSNPYGTNQGLYRICRSRGDDNAFHYGVWERGLLYPGLGFPPTAYGNTIGFRCALPTIQSLVIQPITTLQADTISINSVSLNGSINTNRAATAWFEYGVTASYGSTSPVANFQGPQNISFALQNLTPNTIYHFRIAANINGIIFSGNDQQFTTLPTETTATSAWVAGTGGIGLRLRTQPSLTSQILTVMPEGSPVHLLGPTQTADEYLWRQITFSTTTGWAAAQYLAFTDASTTEYPPAPPYFLNQFKEDAVTPIPLGATSYSDHIILAATPTGNETDHFIIQFEIIPQNGNFSAPQYQTQQTFGSKQAILKIGPLPNQNSKWRARSLNAKGIPSSWVTFSTNSYDLTIIKQDTVLATFKSNPSEIFNSDPIQFTADAAPTPGTTFLWNFGNGDTATGPTPTETFQTIGDTTVTLTVTDIHDSQTTATETIHVGSKALADRVNLQAKQTVALLNELEATYFKEMDAADSLRTEIGTAFGDVGITAAFCVLAASFDAFSANSTDQYAELINAYFSPDIAKDILESADKWPAATGLTTSMILKTLEDAAHKMNERNNSQNISFSQLYYPYFKSKLSQQRAIIEQLRIKGLTAVTQLTTDQANQMFNNLNGIYSGNLETAKLFNTVAGLPINIEAFKTANQCNWQFLLGQNLSKVSYKVLGIAIKKMTGPIGGAAYSATTAELAIYNTLAEQSASAQMLSLCLTVLGQGPAIAKNLTQNFAAGMNALINNQTNTQPQGKINSVNLTTTGFYRVMGFGYDWFAQTASASLTIQNTGTIPAEYSLSAYTTKTYVTGTVLIHGAGIGESQAGIPTVTTASPFVLNPQEQKTVTIDLFSQNSGYMPEGKYDDITYVLTARTESGTYRQYTCQVNFNNRNTSICWIATKTPKANALPQKLEPAQSSITYIDATTGNILDNNLIQPATTTINPLQVSLVQYPNTNLYGLTITLKNPLETPLTANVQQPLPLGTQILNPKSATICSNILYAEFDLHPKETESLQYLLYVTNPNFTNAIASLFDSINNNWETFTQQAAQTQIGDATRPTIQNPCLTNQTFQADIQFSLPGIHNLEISTDLAHWRQVQIITNSIGTLHITDQDTHNYPCSFYRTTGQ